MIMPLCQLLLLFLPLVTYAQNYTTVLMSNTTKIIRSGSGWRDNSVTNLIPNPGQCAFVYTQQIGDAVTFKFTGTDLIISGRVTVSDRSNGRVTVDGSEIPAASYAAGKFCNAFLWTKSNLTNTEHTVVVTSTKVLSGQQLLALDTMWYSTVNNTQSTTPNTTVSDTPSTTPNTTISNTPSTTPNTTVNNTPSTAPKKKNVRAIAGGAAGGGSVVVGPLIVGFLNARNLSYFFNSLAFTVFGWLLFSRRHLIFTTDKDVGPVEITLFLSTHKNIEDSKDEAKETLLTWQVIRIGHSRRDFTAFCPCVGSSGGQTRLGFGTVEDTGKAIKSPDAAPAPITWTSQEWSNFENEHPVVKNNHEQAIDVALGTYEERKRGPVFRPFLHIKDLPPNESYQANMNLYLHAFVMHGYEDGQYDEQLVAAGITLNDLKPITEWRMQHRNGKLVLEYVRGSVNKGEDC